MSPVKSPEPSSAPDVRKKDKIVVEMDVADELPPGWTKEVKIRKKRKTGSATKIDRLYTDPVTGYIFRSLKAAQEYVKTGILGRLAIKPKNNEDERLHMEESAEKSEPNVQMSETLRRKRPLDKTTSEFSETVKFDTPSPMPPEPITREATQLAGIKADTPSRLLPEPKTRQATRLAGVAVDAPTPTPSPLEYKIRQNTDLDEVAVDAPPPLSPSLPELKTGQTTRLAEMIVDSSLTSPTEPKTRKATQKAGIEMDSPPPLPPDTRTSRLATRQAGTKIDASVTTQSGTKIDAPIPSLQDSKTCQATPRVEKEILPSPRSQPEPKTRCAKRVPGIRDKAPPSQPKTRRVTRQAGIKIDSPAPSPPDTRNSCQASRAIQVKSATPKEKHDENADIHNNPNHNQETSSIIPPVKQENHENPKEHSEIEMGPATLPPPQDQTPPTAVVPPVDLGKQELPVVNPTVSSPIPRDGHGYRGDSSIDFSMNDLWTDPCIEFAVKTLTGAIPCGDLKKPENPSPSPLKVPVEELWTDPCIEFAVKTLTGAIPVGEDDHLQLRATTSRNTRGPHDFNLPDAGMSFCQTDVLSRHFETGQNKQQQQQDSTFGNSSFSKIR